MRNEDEFTKEFGELRKRRFWLLVRKPVDWDEIKPVIKVGSRVKWKSRWWCVVSQNAAVGWTVKGTVPGPSGVKQTVVIKDRTEIEDVRQVGSAGGFVLLRRNDWKKLKKV